MTNVRFVTVYAPLLTLSHISSDAKLVYSFLALVKKWAWPRDPGQRTIGETLGMNRRRVDRALRQLEHFGWLATRWKGNGAYVCYALAQGFDNVDPTGVPLSGAASEPVMAPTGAQPTGPAGVPLSGADGGAGQEDDGSQEPLREAGMLSRNSFAFKKAVERSLGKPLSFKAVRHIEPLWRQGVPLAFAVEHAQTWNGSESPWTFCDRVLGAWKRRQAAAAPPPPPPPLPPVEAVSESAVEAARRKLLGLPALEETGGEPKESQE